MPLKVLYSAILVAILAHGTAQASEQRLEQQPPSGELMDKFMQQGIQEDLARINVLDRILATPQKSHHGQKKSQNHRRLAAKRHRGAPRSRKLAGGNLEGTLDALYSSDYTGSYGSGAAALAVDKPDGRLIRRRGHAA